ncbi:MAG: GNAT family N-acetyltransferase [Chloroflexota bacterium]|nr:GNAT family N-acetyltransferase [Chloroflexota bacterium]
MTSQVGSESALSSPAVVIRPILSQDAEAVHELRRQPKVMDGTTSLPSERIEDRRRFIEGFGPDDHVFVAEVDGRVVGIAGLHVKRSRRRHVGEIGMMVHDDFQGQGIGRQLLAALLELADNYLGLIRVELEVLPDNACAVTLYEHFGFQHEGRKQKALLRGGRYADLLVMGRVR